VVLSDQALTQRCTKLAYNNLPECRAGAPGCINGCNSRGTCNAGWCHCLPGGLVIAAAPKALDHQTLLCPSHTARLQNAQPWT